MKQCLVRPENIWDELRVGMKVRLHKIAGDLVVLIGLIGEIKEGNFTVLHNDKSWDDEYMRDTRYKVFKCSWRLAKNTDWLIEILDDEKKNVNYIKIGGKEI
jgi:hypothetical protein